MIYPVVVFGDPVLRKKAADIEKDSIDVKELAKDMFETMDSANGIGIAAPQIGKSIRMFVVDGTKLEDEEGMESFKKVFINPQILDETGEKWKFEEGCLSIPDIREDVSRHEEVTIRYFDENWEEHEDTYGGMKARIIQHEYDHIEGILFTDHISPLKKRIIKGRLANISKGKFKADYRTKVPSKK
ncbi:MAG: peptide deformylase [Bacteroidota bacterium]